MAQNNFEKHTDYQKSANFASSSQLGEIAQSFQNQFAILPQSTMMNKFQQNISPVLQKKLVKCEVIFGGVCLNRCCGDGSGLHNECRAASEVSYHSVLTPAEGIVEFSCM